MYVILLHERPQLCNNVLLLTAIIVWMDNPFEKIQKSMSIEMIIKSTNGTYTLSYFNIWCEKQIFYIFYISRLSLYFIYQDYLLYFNLNSSVHNCISNCILFCIIFVYICAYKA